MSYGTGGNPEVQLNDVTQTMFMQAYPSYVVTWTGTVVFGHPTHSEEPTELSMRMSQDDLETFIRVLRFNNVEEFHVKRESLHAHGI